MKSVCPNCGGGIARRPQLPGSRGAFSSFHLSIGVKSLDESLEFFVGVLGASLMHRDPSGYVNIDFFGSQITLKQNDQINPNLKDFHFGVNLNLGTFNSLAESVLTKAPARVVSEPTVVDAGTLLERKKMYVRCPTGYLIELKGY